MSNVITVKETASNTHVVNVLARIGDFGVYAKGGTIQVYFLHGGASASYIRSKDRLLPHNPELKKLLGQWVEAGMPELKVSADVDYEVRYERSVSDFHA